ncbi:putative RNA methyltransferase [Gordonia liuliyuniae]|uniref:Methyltransferase n=1 Tax=Gordonia liuliyuniae TaxID=2911517 RepID=A0ABS9IX08_9ACTN|nr:methyltransferase [Gordonia liuliyuniae]MCF8590066.1 methyltransferase [Gordonia liuliyuniae]
MRPELFAAAHLACPVCQEALEASGRVLGCPAGHRFDLARQGYVSLLGGKGTAHRSDTADMVAARARVFASGLYTPIQNAVAAAATRPGRDESNEVIVDAAGGTGAYLAAVLDARRDGAVGVSVDLSKSCARTAARAHPRAVSVVADLWASIPILTGAASTVLSVFAPRNVAETTRILMPGGHWVIITPNPGHLAEIVEPMGMLRVGDGKADRLEADLRSDFDITATERVVASLDLLPDQLADIAGMGPAGFHRTADELLAAAADLASAGAATAALDVTVTLARRR